MWRCIWVYVRVLVCVSSPVASIVQGSYVRSHKKNIKVITNDNSNFMAIKSHENGPF